MSGAVWEAGAAGFGGPTSHCLSRFAKHAFSRGSQPLPKLFTTPGFTEASAKAAIEIAERKVMALQRFIKRMIEREIFTPALEQAGFDPKEAECRLEWGMPEALDYEKLAKILPYLVELQLNAVIEPSEVRRVLREVCKLPLEEIERPAV